ncbi:UvrD-helicase domain-containing protein [Carboxylicivirga sp. M1479]|uniref:UvrD-helicase domain-containing protein n=1 Tax=Carboxylicivirga sp. M1479 TaxID=2594476 RepID=UPI001178B641|nr:UvrD-helicase domain-containing protein [Carboxylicivirga sp. M1479]TRX62240.1 ATP-dependent helicase [Carboxylicivirga sp. M1479]
MQLTDEQQKIIEHEGDLKVNAVAGSGKTTTILQYALKRPKASILYLAFNKSVKMEADYQLSQLGLSNVRVETAHSLAYKYIAPYQRYNLRFDYKPHEVAQILNIKPKTNDLSHLKLASHIYRFARYFCNSRASKVIEIDYLQTLNTQDSLAFASEYQDQIIHYTRLFLAKMHKGEIDIIHDFYLKQFQLSKPMLPYDYILFDEGQDASGAMLEAFVQQPAKKIIIGDQHQQIYGWRFATNALQQLDFPMMDLSKSFRFNQEVARLSKSILQLKREISQASKVNIKGLGQHQDIKSRVTLARSNSKLVSRAIELLIQQKELNTIYFEGNLSSYTFSEEGGSIYDVLNLYNHKRHLIKDKLLKTMPSFDHLKDYLEETSDTSLKALVDLVEKYHKDIPFFINKIKECAVDEANKKDADMIFSTVHKAKGMEYDQVFIMDDFISEQQIIDSKDAIKAKEESANALSEEINLLYVAATRTRAKLHIPNRLLPSSFQIHDFKTISNNLNLTLKAKVHQAKPKRTNQLWSKMEEAELKQLFIQGKTVREIAMLLGRSQTAVVRRVEKLDLWF